MKLNQKSCRTCPFREGGLELGAYRMGEIQLYLVKGTNHMCHSDRSDKTICRGGRNYQLVIWHRMGMIENPTDNSLDEAMKGVTNE